jgi:hypothetical protein
MACFKNGWHCNTYPKYFSLDTDGFFFYSLYLLSSLYTVYRKPWAESSLSQEWIPSNSVILSPVLHKSIFSQKNFRLPTYFSGRKFSLCTCGLHTTPWNSRVFSKSPSIYCYITDPLQCPISQISFCGILYLAGCYIFITSRKIYIISR